MKTFYPPEACPLCSEAGFRDTTWDRMRVRVYDCGVYVNRSTGEFDFFHLTDKQRVGVAAQHFSALLSDSGHAWRELLSVEKAIP